LQYLVKIKVDWFLCFTLSCSFSNLSVLTSCVLVLSFEVRVSLLLWNQGIDYRYAASPFFFNFLLDINARSKQVTGIILAEPGMREHLKVIP